MVLIAKYLLAILPLAVAAPSTPTQMLPNALLDKRVCVPPSNCGAPVGNCQYCCGANTPNNNICHGHGETCPDGRTLYHCDNASK
jgi:hypothetical protein